MEIFTQGLALALQLMLPLVGVALAAGIIAGFLRTVTRLEDGAINFSLKLAAVVGVLYLFSGAFMNSLLDLARRSWTSLL